MGKNPSFNNLQDILNKIDIKDPVLEDNDLLSKINIDPDKEITESQIKEIQKLEQEFEQDKEINELLKKNKISPKEDDIYRVQKKDSNYKYLKSCVLGGHIKIEFKISEDKSQAFLDIEANESGYSLNIDELNSYILKNEIKFGIINSNIDKINPLLKDNKQIKDLLIAQGKEAQTGEKAKLEFKTETNTSLIKKYILQNAEKEKIKFNNNEEKNKYIDDYLKQNNLFINFVDKNEIVLQKSMPTKGENGKTVTGDIIHGKMGDDINIRIKRNLKYEFSTQTYITETEGLFIFENNTIWCKHHKKGSYTIELFNDDTTIKLAIIPSVGDAEPVTVEKIMEDLKKNHPHFTADCQIIIKNINNTEALHEVTYLNIQKPIDKEKDMISDEEIIKKKKMKYEIHISKSKMEAYLDITAEETGLTIDIEKIQKLIAEKKIIYGLILINNIQINSLLKDIKEIKDHLIAKGTPAEKGENSHLVLKVAKHQEFIEKYIYKKAKDNKITFESLEEQKKYIEQYQEENKIFISIVQKGQILAQKLASQQGIQGTDVFGQPIPAQPGLDINVRIKRNIKFESKNQIYISEMGGLFIFDDHTMWCQLYKDGEANIDLINDEMQAKLTLCPSIGGADPLNAEDLLKKMEKMEITPLIDQNELTKKIQEVESTHRAISLIIGEGIPAKNGDDAKLEYKVKIATGKRFKILDNDRIDYKEKDSFTEVHKGQLVAILHKAGKVIKDGKTVTGKQILAQVGKDISIYPGKNVTVKKFDDRIEFYSNLEGHLKEDYAGIHVFPIYIVNEDVDLSVGNITFNGDIIVKGNVKDEFKLEAEGDIIIYGTVGNAFLKSNGDITIKNGFFGKSKGKIICKGDFSAKFIENGNVECDNNVIVDREIVNSTILSNDTVIVRGKKGYVMGGTIYCGRKMAANVVGSKAGVKTKILLGHNFKTKRFLEEAKEKSIKIRMLLKRVEEILNRLLKKEKDITKYKNEEKKIYVKSLQKKIILMNQLKQLKKKEKDVNEEDIYITTEPEMRVYDTLYPDVTIQYLKKAFLINEHYSNIKIGKFNFNDKISIQKMHS